MDTHAGMDIGFINYCGNYFGEGWYRNVLIFLFWRNLSVTYLVDC